MKHSMQKYDRYLTLDRKISSEWASGLKYEFTQTKIVLSKPPQKAQNKNRIQEKTLRTLY